MKNRLFTSSFSPASSYLVTLLLFLSPFIAVIAVEQLLPAQTFTFRCWEALTVFRFKSLLPGRFYANRQMEKIEFGDLGKRPPWGIPRYVRWQTDNFGYRNDPNQAVADVVLVGDSHVTGTGLSQAQMLGSVLAERLRSRVYSMGPAHLGQYLADERWRLNPPRWVVVLAAETNLRSASQRPPTVSASKRLPALLERGVASLDHASKFALLHMLRSRAIGALRSLDGRLTGRRRNLNPFARLAIDGSMLFHKMHLMQMGTSSDDLAEMASGFEQHARLIASRGSRLIVFPVPQKESVYFPRVPLPGPSDTIPRLVALLRNRGIVAVDALSPFVAHAAGSTEVLYQPDDMHWSAQGVSMAADLLAQAVADPTRPKRFAPR